MSTEKSERIKSAIKANPNHSDRLIAATAGVSHPAVAPVRRRFFPNQKRRIGRDGRVRNSPLGDKADVLGELRECLSRAETILAQIKKRIEPPVKMTGMSIAEMLRLRAGGKSLEAIQQIDRRQSKQQFNTQGKSRAQIISHLKKEQQRMNSAFYAAIHT